MPKCAVVTVLPEYDPMLPTLFYPVNAENTVAGGQIVRVLGSIGTAARHSVRRLTVVRHMGFRLVMSLA